MTRATRAALFILSGGMVGEFFKFLLDHPESCGPQVTSTDAAFEIDAYVADSY